MAASSTQNVEPGASAVSSASIPNRFDFAEAQVRLSALWSAGGYFHAEPDTTGRRQPFSIVIPPPNVTGALHLGHALNNTLQDTLIRMRRMQGYLTLWMPGTDHAGIATQAVVEKRLREEEGKSRHDLGRERLVERIWNWKKEYETRILGQLQRMGCSCDWPRTRFTLDAICARAVRHTFFDLFRQGKIYRGKRLVNWDTFLQTAVSDDEVFHEPVKGHFWHVRYPVIDPRPGEPAWVTIATTRPETMLGDTAVAVHPNPAGALERLERELEEKLVAAPAKDREGIESQLANVRTRRTTTLGELQQLLNMAQTGRRVLLPLTGRTIPLVADEWAKPEMGSGCVKITPAHDPNDYEVWQRHPEIGAINILNPDGTFNDQTGTYQGLTVPQARQRVVADLEAQGLLAQVEDREIDLAHSDRSKTPIEPCLADQWFVKMDELAQSAMDAVTDGRVRIVPARYAKGYLDWLGEKRDWPVSRQLWWGHRIPIWYARCPAAVLERAFAGRDDVTWISAGDADRWQICALNDLSETELQAAAAAEGVKLTEPLRQDPDVLDTWFSSALWPHSTLGWPEQTPELACFYPTSVLITSRDIITLWVARMVLMGLNNMGEIPFRDVYIHPKILDGYGETMSKSKGNGVDPLDVIDKFGPDALRFGLAYLCTETQDVRMPVQFECPHCESLIEQTKENRELPRINCKKCGQAFSTQWART
ncbi:MAG: valine--tRNA ligase, partial [Pirellulaceae bacterium]